jgi:hypothetical protein
MRMIVICGNENCSQEFNADTKDQEWICPHCDRIIENKNYPFLTAKFMDAKINPDFADWKELYEELIEESRKIIAEKDSIIKDLESKLKKKGKKK